MAKIKPDTSHPKIQEMQKLLNKSFGYKLPENGALDEATLKAINDMQGKLGARSMSADVDPAFLEEMKEAAIPRTKIVVNGIEAWVTKGQLELFRKKNGERAGDAVTPLVSMANEVKSLWDAHESTRKANWFWSTAIEASTGATFPSSGQISSAVNAAKSLEKAARAGILFPAQLTSGSKVIREAYAAMDQYREELFDGGDELVRQLETIRDGCVVVLQVTAALATGGASWQVQVGVSAGVAAYEQVLKEVDKASKDGSYSVESGVVNVFMAAIVDGTVGLILKGGKLGPFMDKVADKAVKEAGSAVLKKFISKAVNGGAQQMIEDGIKGLPGLSDPKKKFTFEDFVKAATESFVKGAGLKILGPVCEKYGKGVGKQFSAKDFEGLGKKINLDKAGEEAVKKTIENVAPAILQKVADGWDPKKDPGKFETEVRKEILSDPKVIKAAQDAGNKGK